LGGPLSLYQK